MTEARFRLSHFLANDKATPIAVVEAQLATLLAMLTRGYLNCDVSVHAGAFDFPPHGTRMQELGGWKSWMKYTVSGRDIMGTPNYDRLIRPEPRLDIPCMIGRGTADLIAGFMREGKDCFAWGSGDGPGAGMFMPILGTDRIAHPQGTDRKTSAQQYAYLRF